MTVLTFKPAALAALGLCVLAGSAHAQLFSDNEARNAINDLRARVETYQQGNVTAQTKLQAAADKLNDDMRRMFDEQAGPTRRGLLDLSTQLQTLQAELARLNGANEVMQQAVSQLQLAQRDFQARVENRLRALEPYEVELNGRSFVVQPGEQQAYDTALNQLRAGEFAASIARFDAFLGRFPTTGYAAEALYWRGNAQYALRDYKASIDSYQQLLSKYPADKRVPEAMLATASCQLELKDAKSAKTTLQKLVKDHPDSEAAVAAKDRLQRLK